MEGSQSRRQSPNLHGLEQLVAVQRGPVVMAALVCGLLDPADDDML